MFLLSEKSRLQAVKNVFRVATALPVTLFVLDLLGDCIPEPRGGDPVNAQDVASLPFKKFWEGLTDPTAERPEQMGQVDQLRAADSRSYAVVAPEYLNLSLERHFIVIDCYLSRDVCNNYITLSFTDGGEDDRKRELHVDRISNILKRLDFYVGRTGDLLKARLKAESGRELGEKLRTIGRSLMS